MLHITNIRINLMSNSLFSKNSFKLVFESDKFILSRNEMFIEEGYFNDGLFKMNIMTIITMNESKKYNNVYSSYMFESCNM